MGGLPALVVWMAVLTDAGLAKQRNLLKLWGLPALQVRVLVPGQLYSLFRLDTGRESANK